MLDNSDLIAPFCPATESEDVIAWWLGPSDEPQIARFDVRMLTLVVRPSGPMPEPRYRWGWGQQP